MQTLPSALETLKYELVSYVRCGEASRIRGVVVSPELWDHLEDTVTDFQGVIGVRGIEGNRRIHYRFWVLRNPSFPHSHTGRHHFLVHHSFDLYAARYLGHETDILSQRQFRTLNLGGSDRIEELNPLAGRIAVSSGSESTWYLSSVSFDDVEAYVRSLPRDVSNVIGSVLGRFGPYHVVNNHPDTEWCGQLRFWNSAAATCRGIDTSGCTPFLFTGQTRNLVGRLLMRPKSSGHGFAVVGIAVDGYGRRHVVPVPGTETNDEQAFATIALKHFPAEEVFICLWGRKGSRHQLRELQQQAVSETWGDWTDYESIGRLDYGTVTGPRDGKIIWTTCANTKAKGHMIDVDFTDSDETWSRLLTRYFPNGWAGWPQTAQDRAFAALALAL